MRRATFRIAFVCCAGFALSAAGCTNRLLPDTSDGGLFSKPMNVFATPSWARATGGDQNVPLSPRGPVAPEDLVGADGGCSAPVASAAPEAPAAPAPPPEPPGDRPVGSMAGDLASAPMPAATPASANPNAGAPEDNALRLGGIALGMSECDVVRRAGLPGNVNIGGGDKGERRVVLTYLSGTWPGIYTFDAGRLKVVDRAPEPAPSAKSPVKKKKAKKPVKPKTAARETERPYVQ